MFYSEVLEMKPIVYLAAYCGRWYSAKLNKAHTILISSFVIFRVISNMTDVMQMFQTKYQLQVRATQNKRSYFVPFIEEMDHQSTKKLTRKSESMETSLPQAATPSSSLFSSTSSSPVSPLAKACLDFR